MPLFWSLATIVAALAFMLLVALLHVLRPDLSPRTRGLSHYATGRHRRLMTAAFYLLALALLCVGLAVRHSPGGSARPVGIHLLWLGALGLVAVAVWPVARIPVSRRREASHRIGALTFFVAAITGAILLSQGVDAEATFGVAQAAAAVLAWTAGLAFVLLFIGVAGVASTLFEIKGLLQRSCFALIVGWLIVAAIGLLVTSTGASPT